MNRWHLGSSSLLLLALGTLGAPAHAGDEGAGLENGKVDVALVDVKDSDTQMVVVRAIVDSPPGNVWKIVSDCAHYKEHMPRIAASRLVKKEGSKVTCQVTISVPFPMANLTAVTEAVHDESPAKMSRRWKLVSGDYEYNDGSWEIAPYKGGTASLVTYKVHAKPKTSVPGFLKKMAQNKALPEMIERVREESAKVGK